MTPPRLIDAQIQVDVVVLPPAPGDTARRTQPGAVHYYLIYQQEVTQAEWDAAEALLLAPRPQENGT